MKFPLEHESQSPEPTDIIHGCCARIAQNLGLNYTPKHKGFTDAGTLVCAVFKQNNVTMYELQTAYYGSNHSVFGNVPLDQQSFIKMLISMCMLIEQQKLRTATPDEYKNGLKLPK